jgi:hypothetical protein
MPMTSRPVITTSRAVHIFEEMISARREYCADQDFIRMDKVWEDLCDEGSAWSIKTYKSKETEDFKRKAGLIVFGDRAILSVDEKLMENAKRGCKLSNFILAHELGHIALDHHKNSKVVKHFQLFAGPNGMSNLPPTIEELEANYAAVFFQCGVTLLNPKWDPVQLAHRAFTDVYSVKNAQRLVQLDVFRRELNRPKPTFERVVL